MRIHTPFAPLVILASLLAGCVSSDPERFQTQVHEWVPIGTEVAEARRIMEKHRFQCFLITTNHPLNAIGRDYLQCERLQMSLRDWHVRFLVDDGKISAYGPVSTE